MGIANKFNSSVNIFTFQTPKTQTFRKLADLYKENNKEQVYRVRAFYINTKSKYGDSPVLVTDRFSVNLPNHMLNTVKEMINDVELTNAVNNCEVGFTIYEYQPKNYKGKAYSVKFLDIEPVELSEELPF